MKKLLLVGLLVLSAVGMAADQNSTEVKVETKLELINNSIIITPDEDGDAPVAATSVLINHGTKDAASLADGKSLVAKGTDPVFIRTTTGSLPKGTKVSVTLNANGTDNNLTFGSDAIAHTLKGTISNVVETGDAAELSIGGGSDNANKFVVQSGTEPMQIDMESTIATSELKGKASGNYSNTSILSVQVMAQ